MEVSGQVHTSAELSPGKSPDRNLSWAPESILTFLKKAAPAWNKPDFSVV
jgi:hypothetical protein